MIARRAHLSKPSESDRMNQKEIVAAAKKLGATNPAIRLLVSHVEHEQQIASIEIGLLENHLQHAKNRLTLDGYYATGDCGIKFQAMNISSRLIRINELILDLETILDSIDHEQRDEQHD
jgi:hypothetical protein